MVNELTISKGAYSVTLYSENIAENYTNKLFIITPAQSPVNQASGTIDPKIVDLLRLTHQLVIKCYLAGSATKTSKQVKDDLVAIVNGAGIPGGAVTLTYDSDTLSGFIEKINMVEVNQDSPSTAIKDNARYEVALTFVVGVKI